MKHEKKKILTHRIIWLSILILLIIIPIIIESSSKEMQISSGWSMLLYIDFVAFGFFIASLLLSYKEYEYNGNIIVVYAGFYHNYMTINGVKVDEHNTLIRFTPIKLSSNIDDAQLNATITLTNRISLKINNVLYNKSPKYYSKSFRK